MGLRDYQVNLVAEVGQHFRRGAGGVCMVLGTGGGKTRTASYMVGKWAERNQQVGWLVHRQELLMQAAMT